MTRADYIIVAFALLLLPFLYVQYWGNHTRGEMVVIRIAGNAPQSYPLADDRRITVEGAIGASVIEIKDGQVRFVDSPCQNKQCIIAGWLNSDGQIAACLPNGISVQVQGRDARFDAVNF